MKWLNPFNWFTSSKELTEDIFDKKDGILMKAGGFIDDLHYSDVEKDEYKAKTAQAANDFVVATLSENTVRSKTRRSIAVMWIKVELFLVLLTAAIAPYDMELAKFYWEICMSQLMFWTTLAIIGFFFGNHVIQGAAGKKIFKE